MSAKTQTTFLLDLHIFKKHIIWKYIVLFVINLSVLGWAFFNQSEKGVSFYFILAGVLILIGVVFWRNGKRQLELLGKTVYEFDKGILKHYGATENCQELYLSTVETIKYETLFGRKRVLLKTDSGGVYSYSRILNLEEFIKNLESGSGKQIQELQRNRWEMGIKIFFIYLPSLITFILVKIPSTLLNMNIFFLILNLNTIFLIHNLSEKKIEGGISERIARRIILILIGFFAYQFYLLFYAT
jgi:hypothetical protein